MITSLTERRVFQATVWQPLCAHIGRTALAVIAIALGVALGLAILLMTRSATEETVRASRSLFAQADLVVQGTTEGFDESLYPLIAQTRGVAIASPVIEVRARIVGHRASLIAMGRDILRIARLPTASPAGGRASLDFFDPQYIQLSENVAETIQAGVGDTIAIQVGVQSVKFKIAGILPSSVYRDVGLMDIAAAQWRLDKLSKLTRIELHLAEDADKAAVIASIEQLLPANVKLTTPVDESRQVQQLVRPITINLLGVALVALFTGAFLVYSTQALAIVRRRREFALLHALGVTAREQIASVIVSGALLGIVGALLGIAVGVALAKFGLQLIAGGALAELQFTALELVAFAVLGIATSIAGSIAPALAAARIPTAQALKAGNVEVGSSRGHVYFALMLWTLAVPLLFAPPLFNLPLLGYTAIAFILFGAVLLIPLFTRFVLTFLPQRRHVGYQTAIAQLRGVAHTATTSVATMLVSVSLMVAMSIMGASLRGSMAEWAEQMFPADMTVQTGFGLSYLDAHSAQALASVAGIERTVAVRSIPILFGKNPMPVTLIARPSNALPLEAETHGELPGGAIPVWINRVLADREQLAPGDTFHFPLAGRHIKGFVRGVWRDYFNPSGALVMDYNQYRNITSDERISSLLLWVKPRTSVEDTMTLIRERMNERLGAGVELEIARPGENRARLLRGFDSLFAIIYLLLAVAVLIGLFGIGVNASAQVLARRAEFGVLRHLGFTRRQIGAVISIEGLCLGALGVLSGFLIGFLISAVMIYVVTPQSFHWTMDLHVPITFLFSLAVAVPIAAGLTALWSGRGAMSDDVVSAVKEDW
ncbi:MAG: ABC transporter permease [Candidatus Obscuribacterales bacterium]|nr:ABC transporter permease [Steroidobacteraceae bacterium]